MFVHGIRLGLWVLNGGCGLLYLVCECMSCVLVGLFGCLRFLWIGLVGAGCSDGGLGLLLGFVDC